MKLYYAAIRYPLTTFLAELARNYTQEGKRVFYIAPNSLSFEKERVVLSTVKEKGSFDMMVTRFEQLARYFTLNQGRQAKTLDDTGLVMLFFRLLSQMEDTEFQAYGKVKQDIAFIQQLVDLYKEMQRSNVTVGDLVQLDSPDKEADLVKILTAFDNLMMAEGFQVSTKIAQFRKVVESGQLDQELADVILVVDGFTRFSAEEEALVAALNGRVAELVIATYASQKAYQATYIEGNIYQAGVEFLRHLAQTYQTKPSYIAGSEELDALGKLSSNIEAHYDFLGRQLELTAEDKKAVRLWEVTNQKEEVCQVALAIRQLLHQGTRYKDIVVLLGDVDSYHLQIGKVFDQYDIPYYLGRAEEMSHHPLVHWIESLERLKRYRFRTEDMLNLLKSGLYQQWHQETIDLFEQYLLFADVKGQAQFERAFTAKNGHRYDLEELNHVREKLMAPLTVFFKARAQSGKSLLGKFRVFCEASALPANMEALSASFGQLEQEKDEQVWNRFVHLLEDMHQIFGNEKLTVADFLSILRAGMLASTYRVVPATVDVVRVKSYDLIEPHTAKYVFAIGLTRTHFPKLAKNTSLLTDAERVRINEATDRFAKFDVVSRENVKKNHFAMISLVNAASEQLVLSAPQLANEAEDTLSPYLQLLQEMGIPKEERGKHTGFQWDDVAHYKSLLARVIEANRLPFEAEWTKEEETFWHVAIRYLRKKLEQEQIVIPAITGDVETSPLEADTLATLYPAGTPLILSASSLTDFYQNEYLYFVKHVLRLRERDSIHPDARSHGNFLHRIFERVTTDHSTRPFDEKLQQAMTETRQEPSFATLYQFNAESQFSETVLLDIARATSLVLQDEPITQVVANEAVFGREETPFLTLEKGRPVQVVGKIDRLDQLTANQAFGVVDYKSSSNQFRIDTFYNGLSPQLMTYIAAVQQLPAFSQTEKIFGAMYLHMLDPIVKLTDTKSEDQILANAYKSLVYKGLFLEEESNRLNHLYAKTKASLFTQQDLDTMLAYNRTLYQHAAEKIVAGQFAVNPYTEDGRSVAGEQLKAITGFEADRHFSLARPLVKGGKKEEWLDRMKKGVADEV
ncbi:ATP-dependent nuclease subunit B [Streptococcus acidominimus]|uniref:ATP-dependent helicase/deoxyribonuclease subunit B n=1 Tax=Streptococcus acidominimus TaxID=1326 RepID=A0A4Y9FPS1_STRAI|nr:ATP-dependent nuclease subunit B [Streptococcus acidominimus]MBF0818624.1 ATP-dependent nuclease subunit B [Streptococcus acidominimus]MBF0838934.1 ATP-dependent nuclease subunit B [Streptococcus acidominimus]MBF0847119.1 ATP-dependent nuclease subunit B [Streptococcus danieliae]TFU31006.1 ATP-dependent nuclease subunit B [Streptococcus acidominimus]